MWRSIAILLAGIVILQLVLFIVVLESKIVYHPKAQPIINESCPPSLSSSSSREEGVVVVESNSNNNSVAPKLDEQIIRMGSLPTPSTTSTATTSLIRNNPHIEGVAVTMMLKSPKWFHRRYTAMIHNVLSNIPSTWVVQIFSNEVWVEKDVLPFHPGLQRLRSDGHPRVIWTPMPVELITSNKKPKEIMKSLWLYESIIKENILFFSGNGVLCANSQWTLTDFISNNDGNNGSNGNGAHYIGVPWSRYNGRGGDGSSHSIRKRSDMIRILSEHPPKSQSERNTQDYQYFTKHLALLEDDDADEDGNNNNKLLASVNITRLFGGTTNTNTNNITVAPFVVSGTQSQLNFDQREKLLHVCPELNIIFPSLHEPSCFGAHPNGTKCKSTICALRDKIPGSGC